MIVLTAKQTEVLEKLQRYPMGRPFREEEEKAAIDELCRMVPPLVCCPHQMQNSLFTRITDDGLAVLNR
jgi:hypothetical protein